MEAVEGRVILAQFVVFVHFRQFSAKCMLEKAVAIVTGQHGERNVMFDAILADRMRCNELIFESRLSTSDVFRD
jgi:hypothetical protein